MTLKKFRKDKGWKLADLAERLGCSVATASRLENGKQQPSYELLERIAKITKGDVDVMRLSRAA